MTTPENRLLPDLDPQEVEGKTIPFKDLPKKVAMSLWKAGWNGKKGDWPTGNEEFPAGALAEATEEELNQNTVGLGPKGIQAIKEKLQKLREQGQD